MSIEEDAAAAAAAEEKLRADKEEADKAFTDHPVTVTDNGGLAVFVPPTENNLL